MPNDNSGFVRDQIEKLRLRLLDLTTRNPLISYKHASRTRKFVRVIDELPDQLYVKLTADSGMRFRSVGRKDDEPPDEKTIQFRRALDAAKLEDDEYIARLRELGDDPGERAQARVERELRERLRERLGMPQRRTGSVTDVTEAARKLNLNPSFDLSAAAAGQIENRHGDTCIQTLLFDDEMDLTLGRIREAVRLSIEEAGVNPLFCVFGYLEWYEDSNSETPLYAPLLLCPLNMERKLVRGQYQYAVQVTGEDTQVNVALAERLKRDFQISLPDFDDEDTPEKYFAKVQKVIERFPEWKLRRWVTVGLFSFARIAMYQDLRSERWEFQGGLEEHASLNRLLAGGIDGAGNVGPLDQSDPENASDGELDLPLIADADSSQLAAIKDVLQGRSLVIEGPPGTGKSQTITNVIAACLAAGKTVLFVAEKMAALNVVRDRLCHAGLSSFCLELHSTKASRRNTVDALAKRLDTGGRRRAETDLESALKRLKKIRELLGRAVEALAQPAGNLGITVQQLLWRCNRAREESVDVPTEVDELNLPAADQLTEIDLGRIVSAMEQFEKVRAAITRAYGSIKQHPWFGVANESVDPIRAEDIVRRVKRLGEATKRVSEAAATLMSLTGYATSKLSRAKIVAEAKQLPAPLELALDSVLAKLADPQLFSVMVSFTRDLGECERLNQSVSAMFDTAEQWEQASPSNLSRLTEIGAAVGFGDPSVAELRQLSEKRQQQAAAWQGVADLMTDLAARAGFSLPLTPAAERGIVSAAELASQIDIALLRHRSTSVLAPGATQVLTRAGTTANALRTRKANLSQSFHVSQLVEADKLRRHAAAVRQAPCIPIICAESWRARKYFQSICRLPTKISRSDLTLRLDELAELAEAIAAFSADKEIPAVVGHGFNGIDTDFTPLLKVAEWADQVRAKLPAGDNTATLLRGLLFEGGPAAVESLAGAVKQPNFVTLKRVHAAESSRHQTTIIQAQHAASLAGLSAEALQLAGQLRLKSDLRISSGAQVGGEIQKLRELQEGLDNSLTARAVLGDLFAGRATKQDFLERCIAYVRQVNGWGLPHELSQWLLEAEAQNRNAQLRGVLESIKSEVLQFEAALGTLNSIVSINYSNWIRTPSPYDASPGDLEKHAARCASDPEGFQLLIDDYRMLAEITEVGMRPLVELLEKRGARLKDLGLAARRVVFQSMTRSAVARHAALANFTGDRHEALRREFRELDHKLKRLRQSAIANQLALRPVDEGVGTGPRRAWTGRALIANEVAKQSRHIPVRELMDRAGDAVQQLMPCFMMSPLSIAQFLKPGRLKFDVVVMDEASQLRPEDAVGAIARGAQIVVVGDPKQLPPTNFFRESDTLTEDDDGESVVDETSVLDQALTIMRPARRLKWHYRSQHGSLIAFSNKEFYDNHLVVFPSPNHKHDDFGVRYQHVPDGRFRNRVNSIEAEVVAQAVVEYVRRHPERSLGVVTMNQPQAELLTLAIDRLAAENEDFEAWRQGRESSLEPFFVKNLENVQGDERDVIFISTVYGRDEAGNFYQRFGPINAQGGHRRLNVLFTRAKCQVIVISSIEPADIRVDDKSSPGLRALKGYLQYAKDGILDTAVESNRSPESEFEVAVASAVRNAGFDVVPQVGVVGYFIDLAVRHPRSPGRFVLGIECDGATYHSSKSARDRDRLRQEVLERLHWRIHRIWSLDWYRNPRRETDKLVRELNSILAVDVAAAEEGQ